MSLLEFSLEGSFLLDHKSCQPRSTAGAAHKILWQLYNEIEKTLISYYTFQSSDVVKQIPTLVIILSLYESLI